MSLERAYNWIFGTGAWVGFSSGNPVIQAPGGNQMNTSEGCDSVSDPVTGALLFYSGSIGFPATLGLWDAAHNLITNDLTNGAGIGPNLAIQAVTVVQKPLSNEDWIIFMVGNWTTSASTYYPILYREYNSTTKVLGSVVTLASASGSSGYAENLTACLHANNRDVWVITKMKGNNQFKVWEVLPHGVQTTPVVSTSSFVYNGANRFGQIKVAPSGRKIVLATGKASVGDGNPETLCVYNFDNETGAITNEKILLTELNDHQVIGCDFSINSDLVYASVLLARNIYKFNLRENPIQQSVLYFITAIGNLGAVQRGPDDKIYIAQNSQNHIIQITNSDDHSTTISTGLITLYTGAFCRLGLPVVPQILDYVPRDYRIYSGGNWYSVCGGDIIRVWDADSSSWKTLQEGDLYYNQSREEFETIQCSIPTPPPPLSEYPIVGFFRPQDEGYDPPWNSSGFTGAKTAISAPVPSSGPVLIQGPTYNGSYSVVQNTINGAYRDVIFQQSYISTDTQSKFLI